MTTALAAAEVAAKITSKSAGSVIDANQNVLLVKSETIQEVLSVLKEAPGLEFDYLADITATDYWDYFEIVYQITSLTHNQKINVKTRLTGRENLILPSVVSVYKGADYQEREIYDLMGISFDGHPNLKRLFLWEGFPGHPLRRDYL